MWLLEVAQVEYRDMANGVCKVFWIKRVLEELRLNVETPVRLFCDNKSAISIANNPVQHDRTKHIFIDRNFIKDVVRDSRATNNRFLTKGYFRPKFESFINKLGMININAPTWEGVEVLSLIIKKMERLDPIKYGKILN